MSEPAAPAQEEEIDVVKYDITVELQKGITLEQFRQTAIEVVGIQEARVDALVKVLRSGPNARIGADIPQDRAFKARDDFTQAGLKVTLNAVLALQKKTVTASDGKVACPACDARVLLPDNRQCPHCGVFVDKVTPEMLLRKKLLEQEKRKMEMRQDIEQKGDLKKQQDAMEKRVRDEIRAELEEEYGLSDGGARMSKATKIKLAGAALGLVAVAFLGGRFLGGGAGAGTGPGSPSAIAGAPGAAGAAGGSAVAAATQAAAGASKGGDIDKILQTLPSAGDAGIVAPESGDEAEQEMAMLKSARNGGPNAQGMSMEQAVAASMSIAQSVGNTTAQRAISGAGGGAAGGGAAGGGATGGPAGAPGSAGASAVVIDAAQITGLPPEFKKDSALEFAVALAEMGQAVRGRGILKDLQNSPTIAPALADKLRAAEVQVNAWGLARTSADRAKKMMSSFGAELAAIKDPALRAHAASQVAVALANQSNAPELAAQPFLNLAAEAVTQAAPGAQGPATELLLLATGKVLLEGVESASRAGQMARANSLAGKLDGLSKQAKNNAASARLLALVYRAKQLTASESVASTVLDSALSTAVKVPDLPARIAAVQSVGELAGAGAHPAVQKSLQSLEAALQLEKGGARQQAASAMAAAYASLGDSGKADSARRMLATTPGLPPGETHTATAQALVASDLALARHLHTSGLNGQAETVLVRIAGYLFS